MRALDPTESERARASIAELLTEFKRRFPGDAACRAALVNVRWPNGVACPRCGATVAGRPNLGRYKCKRCDDYRFSAVAKFRPFVKSHIPLSVWFAVIYLDSTRDRFRAEDLAPKSKPQVGVSVNAVRSMRRAIKAARRYPVFRDLTLLISKKSAEKSSPLPLPSKPRLLPGVVLPPGTNQVTVYRLPNVTKQRCWRCQMRAAVTIVAWTRGSRQLARWDLCRICKAEPLKVAATQGIKVEIT
jgi:hypothetical protein